MRDPVDECGCSKRNEVGASKQTRSLLEGWTSQDCTDFDRGLGNDVGIDDRQKDVIG